MEIKNKLYHYGDSFGTWYNPTKPTQSSKKGFGTIIANHFNLEFIHRAEQALSNYQIATRMIEDMLKFKKGDMVLVNWSFLHRYPVMFRPFKDGRIATMSEANNIRGGASTNELPEEYLKYNVIHRADFLEEEWNLLFWGMIKPILENLQTLGVGVYVSFNNNVLGNSAHQNLFIKFLHGTKLMNVFTDDLIMLLTDNNFLKENEDVHYKFGSQQSIADMWIEYIENNNLQKKT